MTCAITREVSASLGDCELSFLPRTAIDVALATKQHAAYEAVLERLGATIYRLPPEHALPDAVFVEDTALVLDEIAILCRMGVASRRAELESVEACLRNARPVRHLADDATLEGGDVVQVGRNLYVGVSRRTNSAAVAQLRDIAGPLGYRVTPISVTGCLHLKSACTFAGNDTMVINPVLIDGAHFPYRVVEVDPNEPAAADVLLLNGSLVMASGFPRTRERLERSGFAVYIVDVSELQKAEAGVTCMSLIFAASGL